MKGCREDAKQDDRADSDQHREKLTERSPQNGGKKRTDDRRHRVKMLDEYIGHIARQNVAQNAAANTVDRTDKDTQEDPR